MKDRMHVTVALTLATALNAGGDAHACTPAPGWPDKAQLTPEVAARLLTAGATQIDIVVAEQFTDDVDLAPLPAEFLRDVTAVERAENEKGWRETWSDAVRIHYRVVTTLRGQERASLTLNGERVDEPLPTNLPLEDRLKSFIDQKDLANWPGPGACNAPIFAAKGQHYLVMRDKRGSLVEVDVPIRFNGETGPVKAPAVMPISGVDDPWLGMVKRYLSDRALAVGQPP